MTILKIQDFSIEKSIKCLPKIKIPIIVCTIIAKTLTFLGAVVAVMALSYGSWIYNYLCNQRLCLNKTCVCRHTDFYAVQKQGQ